MLKGYKIKRKRSDFLEPEEILLDSQMSQDADENFLAGQRIETPLTQKTVLFFLGFLVIIFLIVWGRIFWLQFMDGQRYRAMAEDNQLHIIPFSGPRGLIYDKDGVVLAQNKASYDLLINFHLLGKNENERLKQIEVIRDIIGQLPGDINQEKINKFLKEPPKESIIFRSDLAHQDMLGLESNLDHLPGVFLKESSLRDYPFGSKMAHLLGYLGKISEREKENYQGYFLIEKIGKAGLEYQYEPYLRGKPGFKKYSTDALLQKDALPFKKDGEPGNSLILHLDSGLQNQLYKSLNKYYKRLRKRNKNVSGAAAVILNPQNGGVLALVSLPAYDGNKIVEGLSREEFANLFESPQHPLFNRVIAGQYPSGSTIKPIVAAAALQEKIISPQKKINDLGGVLTVVNPYNPGVVYSFGDWAVHGIVDMYSAIAKSCNIYFYMIGGGYKDQRGLGIEKMAEYFRKFGLGSKTNIDLPGEKEGLVPTPAWKQSKKGEPWYIGDTYNTAIGQGNFLATPLQMANAIAAIANGGLVFKPQVVDKIVDLADNVVNDIEPEIIFPEPVNQEYLKEVRKGMRQAVLDGSAVSLSSLPVDAAGKTGTAQSGKPRQYHSWFVGFAPYDNPELVIAVLIENGGEGHKAALPVAKEVLNWYFSEK